MKDQEKAKYRKYLQKQRKYYKFSTIAKEIGISATKMANFFRGDDEALSVTELEAVSSCLSSDIEYRCSEARKKLNK